MRLIMMAMDSPSRRQQVGRRSRSRSRFCSNKSVNLHFAWYILLCLLCLECIQSSSSTQGSSSYYGEAPRGDFRYPPPSGGGDDDDDANEESYEKYAPQSDSANMQGDEWVGGAEWNQEDEWTPPPPYAPPPPPPPPRDAGTSTATTSDRGYVPPPIHYQFQATEARRPPPESSTRTNPRRRRGRLAPGSDFGDDDGVPITSRSDGLEHNLRPPPSRRRDEQDGDDKVPAFASPRRDSITLFMDRSMWNRWVLRLAAGTVGAVSLTFVGTSLTTKSWWSIYAWTGFWLFIVTSWFRSPYGELCRTSGFLLLQTIRESRQIRREYPTRPHLKALLGAGPRRPFPPTDNPWSYRPSSPDDAAFSMISTLIAMAIVGSFCGGNIPMVPAWIGGLVGAGFLGLLTTRPSARGDLARTTGMRVVATFQTVWDLQKDLGMPSKFWKVFGLLLDKLLILDRQHRLKDRLIAFLSFIYGQVSGLVQQVQQQPRQSRGPPTSRRDDPPRRRRPWVDDDLDNDDGFDRRPRGPPRRRRPPPRGDGAPPYNDDGDADDDEYRRTEERAGDEDRGYPGRLDDEALPENESKRRKGWFSFK